MISEAMIATAHMKAFAIMSGKRFTHDNVDSDTGPASSVGRKSDGSVGTNVTLRILHGAVSMVECGKSSCRSGFFPS